MNTKRKINIGGNVVKMVSPDKREEAYQAGKIARLAERKRDENPFQFDSIENFDWRDGWDTVNDDIAHASKK